MQLQKNSGAATECINKPIHVSSTTSLAPEDINSDLMTQITTSRQLYAIPPPSNTFSVHTPPTGSMCGPFQCHEIDLHCSPWFALSLIRCIPLHYGIILEVPLKRRPLMWTLSGPSFTLTQYTLHKQISTYLVNDRQMVTFKI